MIIIETSSISKRKLRPFDAANRDDFSMYNKLPYYRDIDLCTPEMITFVTGNVIKYFQYNVQGAFALSGIDNLAILKIKEYQKRENERLEPFLEKDSKEELSISKEEDETMYLDETVVEVPETKAPEKKRLDYLDIDFE